MPLAHLLRTASRAWFPEVLLVLAAIALRLAVADRFDPRWGYDAESHLRNIDWYRSHAGLPPLTANRVAYHPPLFYFAEAAFLQGAGASATPLQDQLPLLDLPRDLALAQVLPVLAGALRQVLVAVALVLCLPHQRAARLLALLLLAVLPASVHLDAMVSNECLSVLLGTLALALLPAAVGSIRARTTAGLALGLSLGLGALTKFSALALVAVAALVAALDLAGFAGPTIPPISRWRRAAGWALCFALVLGSAGWLYRRNLQLTGALAPTPFEHVPGWDRDQYLATGAADRPIWQRRPLGYLLGWDPAIFAHPFFPTGSGPSPRFWPVLVASTFVDHYNYGLARDRDAGRLADSATVNGQPLRPAALAAARVALPGGCVIALTTVAAWIGAARFLLRRRDLARLGILIAPLAALLGQIHFAVRFPVDREGMVKGAYLQLVAAPLAALFGCGVVWLWRRRWGRPLALLNLAAVAAVSGYLLVNLLLERGARWLVFWS